MGKNSARIIIRTYARKSLKRDDKKRYVKIPAVVREKMKEQKRVFMNNIKMDSMPTP